MATARTNIKELRKDLKEYGRRLDEQGIKRAAVNLSLRAANAVKRDFTVVFDQTPSKGPKTVRTGRLRASVAPVIKSQTQFGVGSNVVYARIHELGGTIQHPGSVPRKAKALRWVSGGRVIFATKTKPHPIVLRARHWMSIPMASELKAYLADEKKRLERPL